MSRRIPFGAVPDGFTFSEGIRYRFRIESVEEAQSKAGNLMFLLKARCVAPAAYDGMRFTETFTIGAAGDPDAEQLETWQKSIGFKQFKRLVKATSVAVGDEEDLEELFLALPGQEYLCNFTVKVEPDQVTKRNADTGQMETIENPYAGKTQNRAQRYWAIGEVEPGEFNVTAPQARPIANGKDRGTVKCGTCRTDVPRGTERAHFEQHHANQTVAE